MNSKEGNDSFTTFVSEKNKQLIYNKINRETQTKSNGSSERKGRTDLSLYERTRNMVKKFFDRSKHFFFFLKKFSFFVFSCIVIL